MLSEAKPGQTGEEFDGGATRDLTDPIRALVVDDLEAGLKEPVFENLEVPEFLGRKTIRIDDHKIKRYAFTVDDYHPWAFGASPFGIRIAQAGVVTNDIVQLFTLKYRASHTVGLHTEEQLWFHRPIPVDSCVTLEGTYVESYIRRGLGYVVMDATVTGPAGEKMMTHRGVEVLRTMPGEVGGRGSASPKSGERRITAEYDATRPFILSAGRGMQVGAAIAPATKVITLEQAAVFSRVGEYVRNAHNDLEIARSGGLRVPIVQGQQQMCLLLGSLTRVFGKLWFESGWVQVKFLNTVNVFAPIAVGGCITGMTEDAGALWAELDVWGQRSDGVLTMVGGARCQVDESRPVTTGPVP